MFEKLRFKAWIRKYLRMVDYIGAAQLYLKDNFLLKEPLKPEHIKPRVLGHWGTVPGLNLIYAQLNYLIYKHDCEMLLVVGPGHGAPAVLANLYMEGTLGDVYKQYSVDGKGMGQLIHDFSWPHTMFPSHVTPSVPGSILEGGELGYSLATAYGAVMDNPSLIAACVVGDGESESGPIAAAWHSNKFLNPKTSGAVLPIVHINGYKISNPTIYGRMSNDELEALFLGYGYDPLIVSGNNLEIDLMKAMEKAYQSIRATQLAARRSKEPVLEPRWPIILLRSPKGWKGLKRFHGKAVEGSFHAHGIPVDHLKEDPEALKVVEDWLKSYEIEDLLDENGCPKETLMKYLPKGKKRMGMNPHTVGGNMLKDLKFPDLGKYLKKFDGRGCSLASSMQIGALMMRDLFKLNPQNFRLFCPDELESNLLGGVFQATQRAFMWPLNENDEHMHPDGRVMEMLSEHTLQGWYMGYLLTGRHGLFVSYEAFTMIIASMVDQYAKFLKQSFKISWRKPVGTAIYLNSSVGWRQDHNGFSHQNPSFVSNVLQKHSEFCQIYYPPDANSFLVALKESLESRDKICVIVADKKSLPQWLTLKEAEQQAKTGIAIWEWATGAASAKNPDVVLASAGDYMTQEAMTALQYCKQLAPELKIRFVNVSELTGLCLGGHGPKKETAHSKHQERIEKFFTKDRSVVFAYHGYPNDVEQILWPHVDHRRFTIHGYQEEGSTTTPFDMKVVNKISYFHLAADLIREGAKRNKSLAKRAPSILKEIAKKIQYHQDYIAQHGDDPEDVKSLCWLAPR